MAPKLTNTSFRLAWLAPVVAMLVFVDSGVAQAPGVSLDARPSADSYVAGSEIELSLKLTNGTPNSLIVSTLFDGNVRFVAATLNGAPIATEAVGVRYEVDLAALLAQTVAVVPVASAGLISIRSGPYSGMAQALRFVEYSPDGRSQATFVDVGRPGAYRISFNYQYGGSTPATPFAGKTNNVEVIFRVTP